MGSDGVRLVKSISRKARTFHTCYFCKRAIGQGDLYTLQTVADPRRFISNATLRGYHICGGCLPVEVTP
jgi:hypothetical protein